MSLFWTLFVVAIFVVWAGTEAFAMNTGRQTFSAYVRAITVKFPLLPFLVGALVGGLGVHFWWLKACL
jgi:hypothetical protein